MSFHSFVDDLTSDFKCAKCDCMKKRLWMNKKKCPYGTYFICRAKLDCYLRAKELPERNLTANTLTLSPAAKVDALHWN